MGLQLQDLRVFHALPTPHLLLDRDLVVVDANPAYLDMVGRSPGQLVGRPVFEALPADPDTLGEDGVPRLQRCYEHVLATRRPDTLPAEQHPLLDLRTGERSQRWWSSVVVPVLDEAGEVELLVQRVEDITDYVADRERRNRQQRAEDRWQARALTAETELFSRARETQAARDAERATVRELAALAEVTVRVARAADVEELTDVLVNRGLAALGAQGGAVGVREGDVVNLTITSSLGEGIQLRYAQLPLDDPLPVAVTTATGRRILLPDLSATLSYSTVATEIVTLSDCRAWACLPLVYSSTSTDPGTVLGALLVGWKEAQIFTPAALDVLEAFAAQCAQTLARLRAQEAEQLRAEQTWQLAQSLQRSLLSEPAQPDGLRVVTRYRAAAERAQVGGDWYDSFVTAGGSSTLVVGDVCGHDREAAATMGQLRNLLRGIAYTVDESPAGVLRHLDLAMGGLGVQALATAVVLTVVQDPAQRAAGSCRLRWSNAGHPPPLLIHPDGRVDLLRTEAELLLGLDATTSRRDHDVVVPTGSTLLLYTDGLVERRGADIDVGLEWLARTAAALSTGPAAGPEALCDALLHEVDPQGDDVVLLALRT